MKTKKEQWKLFLKQFHSMQIGMVHTALINETPSWWFGGVLAILNIPIHLSILRFILFRRWLNLSGESFNSFQMSLAWNALIILRFVQPLSWQFSDDFRLICFVHQRHERTILQHMLLAQHFEVSWILRSSIVTRSGSLLDTQKIWWLVAPSLYLLFLKRILMWLFLHYFIIVFK